MRSLRRARNRSTVMAFTVIGFIVATVGLVLPATTGAAAYDAHPVRTLSSLQNAGDGPQCGATMLRKSNGSWWQCTFDDEFSGTTLDTSKWAPQLTSNSGFATGPVGSQACYVNSPRNIWVSHGYLHLTVRKEKAPFVCPGMYSFVTQYTAGMVSTYFGFHQQYGRFEVRAKLPQTTAQGLQETLWLWPTDAKKYGARPRSGEIDFAEFYSAYHYLDVPYIHYVYDRSTTDPARNTNVVTAYDCRIDYTRFNTYAVEWLPGKISITLNGQNCLVDRYVATGLTPPAPFDQPFFIALTQALGIGGNAYSAGTTPLPATLTVDYVRAWK